MIITISGLPGTGTTTASKLLQEKTGMEFISSGEIFRSIAAELGLSLADFGKLAETDVSYDHQIDDRQKELSKTKDNLILEGRLAGHMSLEVPPGKKILRVLLKAPLETRVRRIMNREQANSSFKFELEQTKTREESERVRYDMYYGIDISDLMIYDLVIDSSKFDPETIVDIIMKAADF
ncbi:Cytidylate kinase [Methanimicrococcus sp. At1]|uniref:Cytidylate kinase n=1 Tax=Methanimicrococcus hacksteinii TaxID=3028293 RepID=A0ABU3VQ23_9EURY|nr:AAA family ATPase [Methanimicrococcus sp. At1]MDV0445481.1 Cytidylate kinase [Methanimicrococcus sp. At1]